MRPNNSNRPVLPVILLLLFLSKFIYINQRVTTFAMQWIVTERTPLTLCQWPSMWLHQQRSHSHPEHRLCRQMIYMMLSMPCEPKVIHITLAQTPLLTITAVFIKKSSCTLSIISCQSAWFPSYPHRAFSPNHCLSESLDRTICSSMPGFFSVIFTWWIQRREDTKTR